MKYQLVIEFECEEPWDNESFAAMCAAAFVQVEDDGDVGTTNARMHLLAQEEPKWEKLW